jgi:hypothetical protein
VAEEAGSRTDQVRDDGKHVDGERAAGDTKREKRTKRNTTSASSHTKPISMLGSSLVSGILTRVQWNILSSAAEYVRTSAPPPRALLCRGGRSMRAGVGNVSVRRSVRGPSHKFVLIGGCPCPSVCPYESCRPRAPDERGAQRSATRVGGVRCGRGWREWEGF